MATLPQGVGISAPTEYVDLPTNTFIIDWSTKQIAGTGTGLAAMRQAVEIILNVERFRWQIYDSNFGSELQDLPGNELDYIQSELPRRIEEAFSVDNRILSVDNYVFSADGRGNLTVSFDVQTAYGTIQEEVTVNNDRFERIRN